MKYRKLPIEVEAVQWFEGVEIHGAEIRVPCGVPGDQVEIRTLEGWMDLNPGSWVVGPGAAGEYWAVRDDVFRATYEPVEDCCHYGT